MKQIPFEKRMTENERHDEIMEFVKLNPKRTKAQVMRFMNDKDVSEPTTFKDITYLVGKERLLVLKDKPNSQTHYLIVNNENEFNILEDHIKETCLHLERSISSWDKARKRLSTDYILLEQLIYFSEISGFANRISAIEPKEKREALYPRLIQALELSHELNSLIAPYLYPRVDEFFEETELAITDKKALKSLADMKKAQEDIKKYFFKRKDHNKQS